MDYVGQALTLGLRVKDADWVGLFDRLEVWRSRMGSAGPFEELTAPESQPARLPKLAGDPPAVQPSGELVNAVGETLQLRLNETEVVSVTFTGNSALTLLQLSQQITAAGCPWLWSYVDADETLVVRTMDAGNRTLLRILPSDVAVLAGLPVSEPDCITNGKDARLALVAGKELYTFVDAHGAEDFYYRTRFRSTSTGVVSDFSTPFQYQKVSRIDPSRLCRGHLTLVDPVGCPVAGREVSVSVKVGTVIDGLLVTDVARSVLTDQSGYAEFLLVRGTTLVLSVAGTTIARDVLVPADSSVESFMLLDPSVGHDDAFTVRIPDLDYAVRRSL